MKARENVRLSDACQRHLDRLTGRGYAERTIRSHFYGLRALRVWLHENEQRRDPYVHAVETKSLEAFLYGPKGLRGTNGAAAFNNHLNHLRQFFRFALAQGWVEYDPTATLLPARAEQKDPALILTPDELVALLERAPNGRDRCALAIGMNTGLRANDLKRLTVFDVNLAGGVIQTAIRKVKKTDLKPITGELDVELRRWLDEYAHRMGLPDRNSLPNEWMVIPTIRWNPNNHDGWALNPLAVMRDPHVIVQRSLKALGYPTYKTGFHTLRRSAARALFEMQRDMEGAGRDHALMTTKAFLNHSTTAMTEQYLGLSQERTVRDELLRGKSFLGRMTTTAQPTVEAAKWRAS